MATGFPNSTPEVVILPITLVVGGKHGGAHQVDGKYNNFLRGRISEEELEISINYLNEVLLEYNFPFWPLLLLIIPVIGCFLVFYMVKIQGNERRKSVNDFLDVLNENVYLQRNIMWRYVELTNISWIEISLVEVQDLRIGQGG
eukprot:TRINITY_DN737_c0_g1_i2.p1 TRINITY_DN737_c0_g1~~TRINITY_DN737_c0_g1_i2.p1  ORF type:complete len:144 (-),score=20.69 TRINITY_DN737_c0_g1_i2:440-871(-)